MSHQTAHRTNAPGADARERAANLARGHIVRGIVLDPDRTDEDGSPVVIWSGDWTFDPDEWKDRGGKAAFLDMVALETEAHRKRIEAEAAAPGEPAEEIAV